MIMGYLQCMFDNNIFGNTNPTITVESAGLNNEWAGKEPVTDESVEAMKGFGVDISAHHSRHISDLNLEEFSLFLVVGQKEMTALIEMGIMGNQIFIVGDEGLPDPYGQGQDIYNETATVVAEWLEENFRRIKRCLGIS